MQTLALPLTAVWLWVDSLASLSLNYLITYNGRQHQSLLEVLFLRIQ